jgi:hypothetical protein
MTSGLARSGTADPSGVSNLLATIYAVLHPLEFIESIRSKPEREKRYEFLRLAKAQCEEATKKLPEFIDLDEFVDEGGAITTDLIFDYLSKRNLKAVYSRLRPNPNKTGYKKFAWAGNNVGEWSVPDKLAGSYIRLELAPLGSKACLPKDWMPVSAKEILDRPPFLPETCLAGTLTDLPSTSSYLEFIREGNFLGFDIGRWVVKNKASDQVIAAMPATMNPGGPYAYDWCPGAHRVMLTKIKSSKTLSNQFFVSEKKILVTPDPKTVVGSSVLIKPVTASVSEISLNTNEDGHRFEPFSSRNRWVAFVDNAKRNGDAYVDRAALSWKAKELTTFEAQDAWKWSLSVTPVGVFVYSFRKTNSVEKNWLIRYDLTGNFVSINEVIAPDNGCAHSARALEIGENTIALYGTCTNTTGTKWEIKKKDVM